MGRNLRILAEFAGDWLMAMALFLLACLGSSWCRVNLTPNIDLDVTWFGIWMIPFLLFASCRLNGEGIEKQEACRLVVLLVCLQFGSYFWRNVDSVWVLVLVMVTAKMGFALGWWLFPNPHEDRERGLGDKRVSSENG